MPVAMAMGFRSLPSFVVVLMMFVMDMQVLVIECVMQVFDLAGVVGRP